MMIYKQLRVFLLGVSILTPNMAFSAEDTYADVQQQRQLSRSQQDTLTAQQLAVSELEHRNRLKVLDNEYLTLMNIEKGLKSTKEQEEKEDPKIAELKSQHLLQQQLSNKKDREINKLIAEMESQIFLVDVYEVAGRIRGEFWYQGANEIKTENSIFGEWLITDLTFDGAQVVPIDPATGITNKALKKQLQLMSETEAIARFKKAQSFRDRIIENKLNEVSIGGFSSSSASFIPNNSPTQGLMFQ